ncbi:MAG: hypothetical protein ACI9ZH_000992 [Paracoccaceae bacterium]
MAQSRALTTAIAPCLVAARVTWPPMTDAHVLRALIATALSPFFAIRHRRWQARPSAEQAAPPRVRTVTRNLSRRAGRPPRFASAESRHPFRFIE